MKKENENIENISFLPASFGASYNRKANTTARHGVTRKKAQKILKHTGNLFSKNLQLKGVC